MKRPIGFLALVLLPSPALAWDDISNKTDDSRCAFMQSFDGPGTTTMIVTQSQALFDLEDIVILIVTNENWSLKNGDQIRERITFDAPSYSFWSDEPMAADGGFSIAIGFKYVDAFAQTFPSSLAILKGKEKIDQLNMAGFYSAWSGLKSCRASKVTAKAEADRLRTIERNLPRDPFAKAADANKLTEPR